MRRLGDPESLATHAVTAISRQIATSTPGRGTVIIPGAESVEFTVPPGAAGFIETAPSSAAYLVDKFLYGLSTLALALATSEIPGGPSVKAARSRAALDAALASRDCVLNFDAQVHTIVSDAVSAGKVFRNAAVLATGRLSATWKVAYGLSGFVGQFVLKVILWLVDGVKLIIDGVRSVLDTVLYWRTYRLGVRVLDAPAGVPAQYLHDWYRHGKGLIIKASGIGELSYRTYSETDAATSMTKEIDGMRYALSADGSSLIGTVTSVRDVDSSGNPIPLYSGHANVGDQWRYTLKPDGALDEHQLKPTPPSGSGDNAWCWGSVQDLACGA